MIHVPMLFVTRFTRYTVPGGIASTRSRPVAPNLIRAKLAECIALLDELAYGATGTPEAREAQTAWHERLREDRAGARAALDARQEARRQRRQ